MAVAVDASTPVAATGDINIADVLTSASFTAPTDALLVMFLQFACSATDLTGYTITDSGGLTWTQQVNLPLSLSVGNCHTEIRTARTVSSVARTCAFTRSGDGTGGNAPKQARMKVYVLTGAPAIGSIVAACKGNSTTNNLTTSALVAGAAGLLIGGVTTDSGGGAGYTSSDLTVVQNQLSENYPAATFDMATGYKTIALGASVTANWDAQGAGAANQNWVQMLVYESIPVPLTDLFISKQRPFQYSTRGRM